VPHELSIHELEVDIARYRRACINETHAQKPVYRAHVPSHNPGVNTMVVQPVMLMNKTTVGIVVRSVNVLAVVEEGHEVEQREGLPHDLQVVEHFPERFVDVLFVALGPRSI
jgi:hypothetical protein